MDVNRDSAEYRALIELTPELQLAVKTQLTSLGGHLVSVGLITPDDYKWLINSTLREDKQAANLIGLIQQKVQQDTGCYQTFVDVLQKDQSQYSGIVENLQQTVTRLRQQQRRVKRPLEKSVERAAEKRLRLEGKHSETTCDNSHSAGSAIENPLMEHKPKLAAYYSHQPEVPEGTWPPVKKTQYINLALIRTEQAIDFNKEFLRETIRGSIDDIMKDKDDIKYDEVFTEVEEGARLVFEGRPGCGKTTMLNKVSQDWAKWKIFSSSLLFLVHLRIFGNRTDITLEMLLRSTQVEFTDEEFQDLCTQIKTSQGKGIVFALDGLDEYSPGKKEYKSTFIHKLIKGEVLPKSIVIVASRPAASQKYRRMATKCIEVLGFLKQQIYEYIDSYYGENKDKILGLKTYLEHHPNVMHMCYLPLHMAMVTYLYEIEGASLPQTETEIYNHFTLSTLLRSIRKRSGMELDEPSYLSSFEDLSPDDKTIFDHILKLAFQATVIEARQVFSHDDVQSFFNKQSSNTGNDEVSLGLVVVDWSFVKYGLEEIYTFLHLTFQEYLAACHIVQLSPQAQEELILKYGGDKKLGVVWKFYCGMTKFSDEQKMHTCEQLFEKTRYDLLLQLHCAHESQQRDLCTHVIKSIDSIIVLNKKSLNPADFTALSYVLTLSNVPATELSITSCHIGPEGLSALVKAISTRSLALKKLSFHRTKIREVIPEFCDFLNNCPQLCTLIVSGCDIINKVFTEMAEKLPTLKSLEQLDLSHNNLGKTSVELLGNMLVKLPNLKSLVWITNLISPSLFRIIRGRDVDILTGTENSKSSKQELLTLGGFKPEDVDPFLSYLPAHPCTAGLIQVLNLNRNIIGAAGAQAVAGALQHCTNLQTLNLRWNKVGDTGAQALAEGLQHCTNLQNLDLQGNQIDDAGAQALAEGLQHCTNLQKLDLMDNSIGVAGAQALVRSLQHCTDFKGFFLSRNNIDAGVQAVAETLFRCTNSLELRYRIIGDAGTKFLAENLQYYTDIQKIDLRGSKINDIGAQALAEGLQHCTNLQELNLMDNSIGVAGAQALVRSLQHCTNLKEFYLYGNNIGVAGAQALAEGLPHCTNPQNLNFRNKSIGDAGVKTLAETLQYFTDIQKLDLQQNNIGATGAQALGEGLQHCTNLQKLYLYENKIGDAGAQAVVAGLQHCTNLQCLDLWGNSLTDSSVGSLSQLIRTAKQLKDLYLGINKFTGDGKRALRGETEERKSNSDFVELNLQFTMITLEL